MIKIKKGLNLPIAGAPQQKIEKGPNIKTVAVIGEDFHGMKPTMEVKVGDSVKIGQTLFTDKKNPGVRYTSPGAGKVTQVNRGEKRVLQSVVIALDGSDAVSFQSYPQGSLGNLKDADIRNNLVQSGLWTALRTRPFSRVPAIDSKAQAIFVTAMDTNPLAGDAATIIKESEQAFSDGLTVLSSLTGGNLYVCTGAEASFKLPSLGNLKHEQFTGPHPAGLAGTHIHHLHPVSTERVVWSINYQDVIAVGQLFTTGKLPTDRVVAVAGPSVKSPKLYKTRLGASTDELCRGLLNEGEQRIISGSGLAGRAAKGPFAFIGRYHNQVSVIREGREREFLGWQAPGFDKFSVKNTFISKLFPSKKFDFTTSTGGSRRAMVPIGMYETVMPLDVEATFLLRSLIVGDTEEAQQLGCLELDEEDLALCTFVCPGKEEYGPLLRKSLTTIEKEG